jgi:hypothetical protein
LGKKRHPQKCGSVSKRSNSKACDRCKHGSTR